MSRSAMLLPFCLLLGGCSGVLDLDRFHAKPVAKATEVPTSSCGALPDDPSEGSLLVVSGFGDQARPLLGCGAPTAKGPHLFLAALDPATGSCEAFQRFPGPGDGPSRLKWSAERDGDTMVHFTGFVGVPAGAPGPDPLLELGSCGGGPINIRGGNSFVAPFRIDGQQICATWAGEFDAVPVGSALHDVSVDGDVLVAVGSFGGPGAARIEFHGGSAQNLDLEGLDGALVLRVAADGSQADAVEVSTGAANIGLADRAYAVSLVGGEVLVAGAAEGEQFGAACQGELSVPPDALAPSGFVLQGDAERLTCGRYMALGGSSPDFRAVHDIDLVNHAEKRSFFAAGFAGRGGIQSGASGDTVVGGLQEGGFVIRFVSPDCGVGIEPAWGVRIAPVRPGFIGEAPLAVVASVRGQHDGSSIVAGYAVGTTDRAGLVVEGPGGRSEISTTQHPVDLFAMMLDEGGLPQWDVVVGDVNAGQLGDLTRGMPAALEVDGAGGVYLNFSTHAQGSIRGVEQGACTGSMNALGRGSWLMKLDASTSPPSCQWLTQL